MDVEEVHHWLETVANIVSITFNLILLYLIQFHSTFRVSVYKRLLTIDAVLDLLLGIMALNAQPICLTGDGYVLIASNGFFSRSSYTVDSIMLTLFTLVLHLNVVWIPVQFAYRYIFLCRERYAES
ncbi:hypothetical protein AAVH_14629 [Aphelenchoides avenae]|nr:hypothetical protein AAVH_14629 [Aphelenchus avenae]